GDRGIPPHADVRRRRPRGDRGDQGRARRRVHQGHGPGDGRTEGPPRHFARHGQGERAGEGQLRVIRRAAALLLFALAACGGSSTDETAYVEGNVRKGAGSPATFGPDFSELELGPK